MSGSIATLIAALQDDPSDGQALEQLEEHLLDACDFDALYSVYADLAERAREDDALHALRERTVSALMQHAAASDDPALASALYVRAADLLSGPLERPVEAIARLLDAFRAFPATDTLDRAIPLVQGAGDRAFARELQETRLSVTESEADRFGILAELASGAMDEEALVRASSLVGAAMDAARGPAEQARLEELESRLVALRESRVRRVEALREASRTARPGGERARALARTAAVLLKGDPTIDEQREAWSAYAGALNDDPSGPSARAAFDALERLYTEREADCELERLYEQVVADSSLPPLLLRAHKGLAGLLLRDDARAPQAVENMREALAIEPTDPEMLEALATLLRERREWAELADVLERLRSLTRSRSEDHAIQEEVATIRWLELHDDEGAERLFRRIRSNDRHNEAALAFYDDYYTRKEDWQRLHGTLVLRIDSAPVHERPALALRMAALADEHLPGSDEAVDAWRRVLAIAPSEAAERSLRAVYAASGRWHALLEHLNDCLQSADDPTERCRLLEEIAAIYRDPGRLPVEEMVIKTLRRLVEQDPTRSDVLDELAMRYEALGRWSELAEVLELRLDGTVPPSARLVLHRRLAQLHQRRLNRPSAAVRHLSAILDHEPHDLDVVRALKAIHRAQKDVPALVDTFRHELGILTGRERVPALIELAVLQREKLGVKDEAIACWEEVLAIEPGNERALSSLGPLYDEAGRWEELAELLALRAEGAGTRHRRVEILDQLARVIGEKLSDEEGARRVLRQIATLRPYSTSTRESLEALELDERSWRELRDDCAAREDWKGYVTVLERALPKVADLETRVEIELELARIYDERLHDARRALMRWERALEADPGHVGAARALAKRYEERSSWRKLATALSVLAEHAPEAGEAREAIERLVTIHAERLNDPAEAFRWAAIAVERDAREGLAGDLFRAMTLAEDANRFEELVEMCAAAGEALVGRDEALLQVKLLHARVLRERLQRTEDAAVRYREALEIDPQSDEALSGLEEIAIRSTDWRELEETLWRRVQATEGRPESRTYLLRLGELYQDFLDLPDRALDVYQRLRALDGRDEAAIEGLERILDRQERWVELVELGLSELELSESTPRRHDLQVRTARILEERIGSPERALPLLARVLEEAPGHEEALLHVRRMFDRRVLLADAARVLEPFYRTAGDDERLLEVLEVRAEAETRAEARLEIRHEIAGLWELRPDGAQQAFAIYADEFLWRPDSSQLWADLNRLAGPADAWQELASLYAAATGIGGTNLALARPLEDEPARLELLRRQAALLDRQGDAALAVQCYEEVLGHTPNDPELLMAMARLYRTVGEHELLLLVLQKQVEITKERRRKRELLRQAARLAEVELSRPDEAIELLQTALLLDGGDSEVLDELVRLASEASDFEAVADLYRHRIANAQDVAASVPLHLELADLLITRIGDPLRALLVLEATLALSPGDPQVRATLSALLHDETVASREAVLPLTADLLRPLLHAAGDVEGVVLLDESLVEAALAATPPQVAEASVILRRIAGLYRDELGDPAEALATLERALALTPTDPDTLLELEEAAASQGAWGRVLERLAAIQADAAEAGDTVGQVAVLLAAGRLALDRLADVELAAMHYRSALDASPDNPEALAALDRLLDVTGDVAERLLVLERRAAMATGAERVAIVLEQARLAQALGDHNKAIAAYEKVAALAASHAGAALVALDALEHLYSDAQRWEDLVRVLHAKVATEPDAELARVLLYAAAGVHEERLSETGEALAIFERILDETPGDDTALRGRERLLETMGRWEELSQLLLAQLGEKKPDSYRDGLQLKLGRLQEEQLDRPSSAVDSYASVLDRDPRSTGAHDAIRALWRLVNRDDVGFEAASALALGLLARDDINGLVELRSLAAERFADRLDAATLLREAAELAEERLYDGRRAFGLYAQAFALDPDDDDIWGELCRLSDHLSEPHLLRDVVLDARGGVADPERRTAIAWRAAEHVRDKGRDLDEAGSLYWLVLEDDPKHIVALERLEEIYSELEDWDRLLEVLELVAEHSDDPAQSIVVLYQMGSLLQGVLRRDIEALDVYERILRLDPQEHDAYTHMEAIHVRNDAWDDAARVLFRALDAAEGDGEARRDEAQQQKRRLCEVLYDRRGESELALGFAAELLDYDPADPIAERVLRAMHERGFEPVRVVPLLVGLYEAAERWDSAATLLLAHAAGEIPREERLSALLRAGRIARERLAAPGRAMDALMAACGIEPTEERLDELEDAAEQSDRWGDLDPFYEDLAEQVADDALKVAVGLRLGDLRERWLDDPEGAAAAYAAVLGRDERCAEAAESLERLYRRLERWEDLIELFEQGALGTDEVTERVSLYLKAASLWDELLERPERAIDNLERVLELDPSNRDAFGRSERIWLRTGAFLELNDLYGRWLELESEPSRVVETRFKLAFLLAEQLDSLDEAFDQFGLLLRATPGYPAAVRYLETLLDRLPDDAEAAGEPPRVVVARLLESQYDSEIPWQRWLKVIEAQLAHTTDPESRALLLIRLGELLRDAAGDPESALVRLSEALHLVPGDESLEALVEQVGQATEAPGLLLAVWEDMAARAGDPELQDRYLQRAARLAVQTGDTDLAADYHRRLLERRPDDVEALAALELHHRAAGDKPALADVIEQRLQREGTGPERLPLLLEVAALREGLLEPEAAAEHYRRALEIDPRHMAASERLETILSDTKDWVSLAAVYRARLATLESPDARMDVQGRLAQVFERFLGRIDEAVSCYREIFDLNPNNLYAITSLERLYPVVERWDELLDVLHQKRDLLASPRDKVEIDFQIGRLYQDHLGQADRALEYYRLVLQRDERHEATTLALEELLRSADSSFEVSLVIERIYEAQEEWRKLTRLYAMQLQHIDDPDDRIGLYMRSAELYEQRLGEPDQALSTLAKALRQDLASGPVREQMVAIAEAHDRFGALAERAAEVLDEVGDVDGARDANLWLARLCEDQVGDREEAIRRYRRVLDFDEVHGEALSALERLYQFEERWSELVDLLTRRAATAKEDERPLLRLRIAELYLDRLRDADASLTALTELVADDKARDGALGMLERLAGRHPEMRDEVLTVIAPIYRQAERWDRLAHLTELCIQATRDRPRRAELGRSLSALYLDRLDDRGKAFVALAQALAADPAEAAAVLPRLTELGEALDRWEDLAVALDKAVDETPTVDARLRAALLLRAADLYLERLDRPADAEARLRAVLAADVQPGPALEMLERLYERAGRHEDLAAVCEQRLELPLGVDERKRLLAKIAHAARAGRDTDTAVQAWRRVLELDAADAEALRMLELVYEHRGDNKSLAAILERQAAAPGRKSLELAQLRMRLARLREEKLHDLEGAIEAYEDVLELSPDHTEALAALERLYTDSEMWEQLRSILERQVQTAGTDKARIGLYHRLARLHERQLGDVEGAIEFNQRVVDLDRSNPEAINDLVRIFHKSARWRELVELYEAKILITPPGPERNALLVKSAEIYERSLDEPDRAMDNLQDVLEHEPEHVYALKVLARLKERHGDWVEALEILEQLLLHVSETDERTDLLVKLGRLQMEHADDEDAALDAFAQAIELDPNHRAANESLRQLYGRRGRWEELVQVLQRQAEWTTGDKERAALFRELAVIYRDRLKRRDKFLYYVDKAHELRPDDPETIKAKLDYYEQVQDWEQVEPLLAWMVKYLEQRRMLQHVPKYAHKLGVVLERLGRREDALAYYRLAYKQDATYFPNLLSFGRLLIRLKQFDQALIVYQAMQLQQHDAPDDVKIEIFFNLGQICLKLKDPRKAKQYFQRLLRIDRAHAPTLEILKKIEAAESES